MQHLFITAFFVQYAKAYQMYKAKNFLGAQNAFIQVSNQGEAEICV